MVVVLPWHDPLRVAEQVSMLDHMSDGRVILGIGRGLGRVEFEGFRVPMAESRDRFVESAEMILEGLENGLLRVRRHLHQAAAQGHPPGAVQVVQGPHLCRGGVARVRPHHGGARRRHPDHPAEAVGRRSPASSPSTGASTARSTAASRRRRSRRAGPSATRTASAPARWRNVHRRLLAHGLATTSSAAITSARPRATSTTARCRRW